MACASCNKSMPSIGKQLVTAAGAAYRVINAAVHGDAVQAREETVANRKSVCLACEHCVVITKKDLEIFHRCCDCGCWLDGKSFSKWSLATERCRLGKWSQERSGDSP